MRTSFPPPPYCAGAPAHPDVLLVGGGGINLLYHRSSRRPPETGRRTQMRVPLEPHFWVLPTGSPVDRNKLMMALKDVQGIYIRASYGTDPNAQAR